jgi:predicted DNA-binding protein (UPF0251 family)
MPTNTRFGNLEENGNEESVQMSVDEYETIRLIDLNNYTQEECANQMLVARTTVQAIYNSARKKLADALINNKILLIEGGNYQLCDGKASFCGGRGCHRYGKNKEKK